MMKFNIPQSKIGMAIWSAFWVLLALAWVSIPAFATGKGKDQEQPPTQTQDQGQHQGQGQAQGQAQGQGQVQGQNTDVDVDVDNGNSNYVNAEGGFAESASAAFNEGNEQNIDISSNYEASAPDVVQVLNNNTADCHKVYGLTFSNTSGGGGIGWPYRDKACDYDKAGDAAAATGDHDTAWFWRCHKKNLYKPYRNKGETVEQARKDCHLDMVDRITMKDRISFLEDKVEDLNALRLIEADRNKKIEDSLRSQNETCNESVDRATKEWMECQQSGK